MRAAQRASVLPPANEGRPERPEIRTGQRPGHGGYNPRCIAQNPHRPVGMCASRTLGFPEVRAYAPVISGGILIWALCALGLPLGRHRRPPACVQG